MATKIEPKHKVRKRTDYHNLESYDDELEIVRQLLERSKEFEDEMVDQLADILEELYDLYDKLFPYYYHADILDKYKLQELILSLAGAGSKTEFSEALDDIKDRVEKLQNRQLMAWLILDYQLTAKKTAESIGPKATFTMPPNIKQIVQKPWCKDHKTFFQRIKANTKDMDMRLRAVILKGVASGWTPKQMGEYFRKITGMTAYKAQRLLRTETMAVYSKATKQVYLQNGIEYVEIIGDAACGGICLEYVGEYVRLEDAEVGDLLPPYHPNCACSFCAYTEFGEDGERVFQYQDFG